MGEVYIKSPIRNELIPIPVLSPNPYSFRIIFMIRRSVDYLESRFGGVILSFGISSLCIFPKLSILRMSLTYYVILFSVMLGASYYTVGLMLTNSLTLILSRKSYIPIESSGYINFKGNDSYSNQFPISCRPKSWSIPISCNRENVHEKFFFYLSRTNLVPSRLELAILTKTHQQESC